MLEKDGGTRRIKSDRAGGGEKKTEGQKKDAVGARRDEIEGPESFEASFRYELPLISQEGSLK